jgi:hypothetical protein
MNTFLEDGADSLEAEHGAEAVTVAQDLAEILEQRLSEESAYVSLWPRFAEDPSAVAPQLTGALEALVEADPAFAKRLNGLMEEFHRVIGPFRARATGPRSRKSPVGGGVPDTTYTTQDDAYADENEYLYGDVRSSSADDVGRGVRGGQPDLRPRARLDRVGPDITSVTQVFEMLEETLETQAGVEGAEREQLRVALEGLKEQFSRGAEADVNRIFKNLYAIKQTDQAFLELMVAQLSSPVQGFDALPNEVFQRMQVLVDEDL